MTVEIFRYRYEATYPVEQHRSVPAGISSSSGAPIRLGEPLHRETPTHMTFGTGANSTLTESGDANRDQDCHPALGDVPASS
jgi:hypothetical protein